MNTEFIILIVGFGTCIVISVFAAIFVGISLKRFIRNNSGLNNIVYNTEQMKETLAKKCDDNAIETKGILEHPSTLEFEECVEIDKTSVKKRSHSYCATVFDTAIAETDEFNNIVKALESKDKKPSLTILDLPTNVKDSSCK